ncbi:MAG: hypothetical protein ACHREM_18480, partial [Polyangiales bacterium]
DSERLLQDGLGLELGHWHSRRSAFVRNQPVRTTDGVQIPGDALLLQRMAADCVVAITLIVDSLVASPNAIPSEIETLTMLLISRCRKWANTDSASIEEVAVQLAAARTALSLIPQIVPHWQESARNLATLSAQVDALGAAVQMFDTLAASTPFELPPPAQNALLTARVAAAPTRSDQVVVARVTEIAARPPSDRAPHERGQLIASSEEERSSGESPPTSATMVQDRLPEQLRRWREDAVAGLAGRYGDVVSFCRALQAWHVSERHILGYTETELVVGADSGSGIEIDGYCPPGTTWSDDLREWRRGEFDLRAGEAVNCVLPVIRRGGEVELKGTLCSESGRRRVECATAAARWLFQHRAGDVVDAGVRAWSELAVGKDDDTEPTREATQAALMDLHSALYSARQQPRVGAAATGLEAGTRDEANSLLDAIGRELGRVNIRPFIPQPGESFSEREHDVPRESWMGVRFGVGATTRIAETVVPGYRDTSRSPGTIRRVARVRVS